MLHKTRQQILRVKKNASGYFFLLNCVCVCVAKRWKYHMIICYVCKVLKNARRMNMWAHWKKYPFTHHPKSFDWNGFVKILTKILVLGFFEKWLALGRDSTIHVIMAETKLVSIYLNWDFFRTGVFVKCHSNKGRFSLYEVELRLEFQPPFPLFFQFSSKLLKLLVVRRLHLLHSLFQRRHLKLNQKSLVHLGCNKLS